MRRFLLSACFVFINTFLLAQTQVGEGDSPIYHYNNNMGIGVNRPLYAIDILKESKSGQELIFKSRITDAPNDYFMIFNGTMASGQFIPSIQAFHNSDNRSSLGILAVTDESQENGNNPLMGFDSRLQNGPIQNRPLFGWSSYGHRKMTMLANGNLGIGTHTPSARLQVEQSSGALLRLSNDTNNYLYSGIDASGAYIEQVANTSGKSKIRLQTRNSNQGMYSQFFINGENNSFNFLNGVLGIGTTTPYRALHIRSVGWDNQLLLQRNGHTTGLSIMADNGSVFFYKVAGIGGTETKTPLMVFKQATGNLGVGNTNPTEKLVVNGKILAEEVRVQSVPASDYVFEPDYDLKPICEVEAFIKENKHLPDIPSAEEFKENGVGLGEMDDMLLRKVEELTLYVIEQNKKLGVLIMENKAQSKEIEELKSKLNR